MDKLSLILSGSAINPRNYWNESEVSHLNSSRIVTFIHPPVNESLFESKLLNLDFFKRTLAVQMVIPALLRSLWLPVVRRKPQTINPLQNGFKYLLFPDHLASEESPFLENGTFP